jgi:Na+/proline symporter
MQSFVYWIGFAGYCLLVVIVGYRAYRRDVKIQPTVDTRDFWSASQSLSAASVGLSISASMMSISWSCVYAVQLVYWYGLGALWLLTIPWLMATAGFYILAPRFRRLQAFSQPEMIGRSFGQRARELLALPLAFVFLIWCGAEIYAAANILAPLMECSPQLLLFLIALVVATYSYLGGFAAVVATDKVQYAFVAIFIFMIAALGWQEVARHETIKTFMANLPTPPKTTLPARDLFSAGTGLIFLTLIAYLPGWLIETDVWLRLQAARSLSSARRGVLIAATNSVLFIGICPLLIGLCALYLYPPVNGIIPAPLKDGAAIFTVLLQAHVPLWLGVLLSVGLASAAMSTIDTCGNVVALSLSYDVIEPRLKNPTPAQKEKLVRIMSAVAIGLAYLYSLFTESLWDIFYLSSGVLTTTIALPMLALFFPSARREQVHAAIIGGFVTTLIGYFAESRGLLESIEPAWLSATGLGYILWGLAGSMVSFLTAKALA